MKKIILCIVLCLTLVSSLAVVSFAEDSAEQAEYVINPGDYTLAIEYDQPVYSYEFTTYFSFSFDGVDYICVSNVSFTNSFISADNNEFVIWSQGDWYYDSREIVITVSEPQYLTLEKDAALGLNGAFPGILVPYSGSDNVDPEVPEEPEDPSDPGLEPEDPSDPGLEPEDPSDTVVEPEGIYFDLYDLFVTYVYGDADLTSDMRLTATILSTVLCVFVFSLPFIFVLWICKYLFAWRF